MPSPLIHHVGLSVRDIEKSAVWYAELFDLTLAAEFDEPAPMKVFMTPRGQAIDLRQDPALEPGEFSQTRVGLDHLAFVCTDRAELDSWQQVLSEYGVENSGIVESPFGQHINFRDPDQIALEFYLPAGSTA